MQLERARLRRPPQSMMSINQKFDINKFNFNKISEENEMVCELINGDRANNLTARDIMIINVSPVGRGHCLLVPQVEGCYQQVMTEHALILALETMLLSKSLDTKLAFNSLCAYASVNHLHWHFYYQANKLIIQSLPLIAVINTPFYVFPEMVYPAKCWIFLMSRGDSITHLAKQLSKMTSWFADNDVAHNIVITRGAGISGGDGSDHIRVFVWARVSVVGAKDPGDFVMAALELSGQILVYESDKYNVITEDDIISAQQNATLSIFNSLMPQVLNIYT